MARNGVEDSEVREEVDREDESYHLVFGVEDSEVREEVDRICGLLQLTPPKTIILKDLTPLSQMPRLRDRGKTIVLYRTDEMANYTWQISEACVSFIVKKSPNLYIRNLRLIEFFYMLIAFPDVFLVVFILAGFESPFSIFLTCISQLLYILASIPLFHLRKKEACTISESWLKIGGWTEDEALDFMRWYPRSIIFSGFLCSSVAVGLALNLILTQS